MSTESHPAAAVFPLMDGIELAALIEDIRYETDCSTKLATRRAFKVLAKL